MALQYSKLTKLQKLAAFLIAIGPESAGKMMKNFENAQLELICREIADMPMIDAGVQSEALREFAIIVSNGIHSSLGGVPFAQTMLGQAKNEYEATAILNRCSPVNPRGAGDEICKMDTRQLLNLVKNERPQTVAFILSCLEPKKAAELVSMLDPEVCGEVVQRLGAMDRTSQDAITKVAKNLGRYVDRQPAQQAAQKTGGVRACVELLNGLSKELRKTRVLRNAIRHWVRRSENKAFASRISDVFLQRISSASCARWTRQAFLWRSRESNRRSLPRC
jgi:flagellar motor switch protein FliG